MTDAEYAAWLETPDAYRTILLAVKVRRQGIEQTQRLSNTGYVSWPTDNPPNVIYSPYILGGMDYQASINLGGGSQVSFGDIQLNNEDGALDSWLDDVWTNGNAQAFLGDVRWPLADFKLIFNGVVGKVDPSAGRNIISLQLRDKLQRLDMPITTQTLGGTGPNKDQIIPLAFGECHNITPLMVDEPTLTYQFHQSAAERVIEGRTQGIPYTTGATAQLSAGKYKIDKQPFGNVTLSVQGDSTPTYANDVAELVIRLTTRYGSNVNERFALSDIDIPAMAAFRALNPQGVGLYVTDRGATVFQACEALASSIGARLVMNRLGQLILVKIALPPVGTPRTVTEANMRPDSLHIAERIDVIPGAVLNFCKNWTIQENLSEGIPQDHRQLYSQEWLVAKSTDPAVATLHRIYDEPKPQDTLLLSRFDADNEAVRLKNLRVAQRHVYMFDGYAELMFTEIGSPMILKHWRFGLSEGKLGQVVYVAVNWFASRCKIGVLL